MPEPCEDMHLLVQADLDGELDAAAAARLAGHVEPPSPASWPRPGGALGCGPPRGPHDSPGPAGRIVPPSQAGLPSPRVSRWLCCRRRPRPTQASSPPISGRCSRGIWWMSGPATSTRSSRGSMAGSTMRPREGPRGARLSADRRAPRLSGWPGCRGARVRARQASHRRLHLAGDKPGSDAAVQGYKVRAWTQGGMMFRVVSDLGGPDMDRFVGLLRAP